MLENLSAAGLVKRSCEDQGPLFVSYELNKNVLLFLVRYLLLRGDSKWLMQTLVSQGCEIKPHLLQLHELSPDSERAHSAYKYFPPACE